MTVWLISLDSLILQISIFQKHMLSLYPPLRLVIWGQHNLFLLTKQRPQAEL